jgi:hypothetical protein
MSVPRPKPVFASEETSLAGVRDRFWLRGRWRETALIRTSIHGCSWQATESTRMPSARQGWRRGIGLLPIDIA